MNYFDFAFVLLIVITFSVKQIAERYLVSVRTVLEWIRKGELRAVNCSRNILSKKPRYRISDSALQEFEILRQAQVRPPRKQRKRKQQDVIEFY